MSAFNWIVAGRRAVVTKRTTYRELVLEWRAELFRNRDVLQKWYGIDRAAEGKYDAFDAAIGKLSGWEVDFFVIQAMATAAAREKQTTRDKRKLHFKARLWWGPLRVLLENKAEGERLQEEAAPNNTENEPTHTAPEAQQSTDPTPPKPRAGNESGPHETGREIHNPMETQEPPLRLTEFREIDNRDAPLLMGDVVELPLWKLLAAAKKTDFGSKPGLDDKLQFNPEGSYLLNSSVQTPSGESPPKALQLHDNLIAMRFQLLLNLYVGGFYHLLPVFRGQRRAVSAVGDGREVYARGMIYAGVLYSSRIRSSKRPKQWQVYCNQWGSAYSSSKRPKCLPSEPGHQKLMPGLPLTPGSVCSDTTLFLHYYMMRLFSGRGGKGSVGASMNTGEDAPERAIHGPYEKWTYHDIRKIDELHQTDEEKEERRKKLRKHLDEVLKKLPPIVESVLGEKPFLESIHETFCARPDWKDVARYVRDALTKALKDKYKHRRLGKYATKVRARIRRKGSEGAERALLVQLHQALVSKTMAFVQDLDRLVKSEAWQSFDVPDFVKPLFSDDGRAGRALAAVRGLAGKTQSRREESRRFRHLGTIIDGLRWKDRRLRRLDKNFDKLVDAAAGIVRVDMSDYLSAVNTVSTNGHEWALVRLNHAQRLTQETELPRAGFLAAYNPLSGEPYGPTEVDKHQFYVFEAAGTLPGYRYLLKETDTKLKKQYMFGSGPFKWKPVADNKFSFKVDGKLVWMGDSSVPRSKRLLSITRLKGESEGDKQADRERGLRDAHLDVPEAFRWILVKPTKGAPSYGGRKKRDAAYDRLITNGPLMYSQRAVPFPTILEARGAWAEWEAVEKILKSSARERGGAYARKDVKKAEKAVARAEADLARAKSDRAKSRANKKLTERRETLKKAREKLGEAQ